MVFVLKHLQLLIFSHQISLSLTHTQLPFTCLYTCPREDPPSDLHLHRLSLQTVFPKPLTCTFKALLCSVIWM